MKIPKFDEEIETFKNIITNIETTDEIIKTQEKVISDINSKIKNEYSSFEVKSKHLEQTLIKVSNILLEHKDEILNQHNTFLVTQEKVNQKNLERQFEQMDLFKEYSQKVLNNYIKQNKTLTRNLNYFKYMLVGLIFLNLLMFIFLLIN